MRKVASTLTMTLAITAIAHSDAQAEIVWQSNLRTAHTQAQSEGKLLLLHFYSDNCKWCDQLEKGAFQHAEVDRAISQNYVAVKVHANTSPKLAEMFNVSRFPTDVIVTTEGKTLSHTVSPQEPDRYVAMLRTSVDQLEVTPSPAPAAVVTAAPAISAPPPVAEVAEPIGRSASNTNIASPPISAGSLPGYATYTTPQSPAGSSIGQPMPGAAPMTGDRLPGGFNLPDIDLSSGTPARVTGSTGFSFPASAGNEPSAEASSSGDFQQGTTELDSSPSVTDADGFAADSQVARSASSELQAAKQPDLAMQGFCPVTVIRDDKWVEGKPEFGVIHLGKLYLFRSKENMQTFLGDPVPYTPVLNEIDAVIFFEERRIVPGKREWGLKDPIYNRMFFFADEASMTHFYNQYERYTKAAIDVMEKAVKDANPDS